MGNKNKVRTLCCNRVLSLRIFRSVRGLYVGTYCPKHKKYDKYSHHFFQTKDEAIEGRKVLIHIINS